jgi:hypothetical protein
MEVRLVVVAPRGKTENENASIVQETDVATACHERFFTLPEDIG